jgi:hypothetical protein
VKALMLAFFSPSADPTSPSIPGRSGTEIVSCLAFGISPLLLYPMRPVQSRQQHSPGAGGLATRLEQTSCRRAKVDLVRAEGLLPPHSLLNLLAGEAIRSGLSAHLFMVGSEFMKSSFEVYEFLSWSSMRQPTRIQGQRRACH